MLGIKVKDSAVTEDHLVWNCTNFEEGVGAVKGERTWESSLVNYFTPIP